MELRLSNIIGHRGLAGLRPENTLCAIDCAAQWGLRWIEIDVKLSADKTLVVFHDDSLERTTNGSGMLSQHKLLALQALDAGSFFSGQFSDQKIPTLDQVLSRCVELDLNVNIELKPNPEQDHATGHLAAEAVLKSDILANQQVLFSSYSFTALSTCQKAAPLVPRALLSHDKGKISDLTYTQLDLLACASIHLEHKNIVQDMLDPVKKKGYRVLAHTVNDLPDALRLWSWGVDSVFSDFPLEKQAR